MIPLSSDRHFPSHRSGPAMLLLNGEAVGLVDTRSFDASWYFADFKPNPAFCRYAPIYGSWATLMHAEGDDVRISRDTAEELAKAEALLDSIRAELIFLESQHRVNVAQLTIDQDKLEWKEY